MYLRIFLHFVYSLCALEIEVHIYIHSASIHSAAGMNDKQSLKVFFLFFYGGWSIDVDQ